MQQQDQPQHDPIHTTRHNPDQLYRFLFNQRNIRGELVTVSNSWRQMLANHAYPKAIQTLLGETLVATSLLTATLKFASSITVQLQGDGPLSLLVINGNHQQQLRGIARFHGDIADDASLTRLIGNGVMVITITPEQGDRYQGVVPLDCDNLAACLESYFQRSEQLDTRLFIRCDQSADHKPPVAAGILLQTLPAPHSSDHDLHHLATLTHTISSRELDELPAEQILWRLYHEESVILYPPQAVSFKCTCSRQRCADVLASMDNNEISCILAEKGEIDMHCDYCGQHYLFTPLQLTQLQLI